MEISYYTTKEKPGLYGVGFLIKKKFAKNIEEIRGISERIAILNIKLAQNKDEGKIWSIIQAYSPTEPNKKEDIAEIEKFYCDLQTTIENASKNVIVMSNFNGQIGTRSAGEEFAIAEHGFENRSKNGARLVTFALQNKLCILNSF